MARREVVEATEATSAGELSVTWGVNKWVMIDAHGQSVQQQVSSRDELATLLGSIGLGRAEAASHADALWHSRPKDAATERARPDEAAWRATGLPMWALGIILCAVLVLFVVALYLFHFFNGFII